MAAITPSQRELGWNVNVCLSSGVAFAGFYQNDDYVSIAEARRELELCFTFEKPDATDDWQVVLLPTLNTASTSITLLANDMRPFPTPPPNQKVYYVLNFEKQGLYVPLIKRPRRRFESRYLQIGKPSVDVSFGVVPFRGKSSEPPRHASASPARSQSPTVGSGDGANDGYPPELVEKDAASSLINSFQQGVLAAAGSRCAISGKGKGWCPNDASFGPAMKAAHIVPQIHWNVYPDAIQDTAAVDDSEALRDSWLSTWQYRNGLALAAHLHICFDARLISIDPRSNRIRAFMPYDLILEYHNKKAIIPPEVDRCALQHHYDMCCIENMATAEPVRRSVAPRKISSLPLLTSTASSQAIADLNKKTAQSGNIGGQSTASRDSPAQDSSPHDSDLPIDQPPSPPSSSIERNTNQKRTWRLGRQLITRAQEADEFVGDRFLPQEWTSDDKDHPQATDEIIQCQPRSSEQEAWRFGLDIIKDPAQARKLMQQGFLLQELSSDEEEATRGRPRKRRCRRALECEERHA
ncbi:hypothetical protein GQX73_g6521 [Xylaria multiplex]|uniref:HNH nuclease domain-containing protein n=1 Tax=Xylaria multiplex TaxID=323545 RepID=A0A7C8IM09_9PEZI|nr:hypothetical protein GQX73_g6521 [Xylaria multiplex]